ncbi:hypothetical protein O3P69_012210 [Scylla paramamosain]|uniref:Uncharacterized protein n=1 Tax=Scylla paramamosain TaxID=85552 RepID=A0AAW0TD47_SCYPA
MSQQEEVEEGVCEELEEPERPPTWSSGWDDECTDVEADPDPHATPEREILWACENGHQSVVERILLQHPQAVAARDSDGYTPLHRAAYSDHLEIIKLLLQAGASVSAKTVDGGQTPLHLAAVNPQARETLQLLLQSRQVKPLLANSNGETARDIAVRSGPFVYLFEVAEPVLNVCEDPE